MKLVSAVLAVVSVSAGVVAAEPVELKQTGNDNYVFAAGQTELAVLKPDAWQGNLKILSSANKTSCGASWPHFLMYSEGKWLTDRVESEGLKLVEFQLLKASGPLVGYRGKWQFRDICISSECHFAWYDAASATQFHLVRTQMQVLKDLADISSAWVEFMTSENSFTEAAAKTKGGKVISMDVSGTGVNANMHYLDGCELDRDGWITIYGARKGQDACVAMVPLKHGSSTVRPRINNGHVDNIEIHMLDPRQHNQLKQGQTLSLEYLLIVGRDHKDWRWIDPAVAHARAFMTQSTNLFNSP